MMKAILGTLSGIALIAFTYLCITLTIAVRNIEKHTSSTMMSLGDTITRVNTTLDKINGKGGTLQQTTETIVRVKDLITLTQLTLFKQQKSIALLDAQVSSTMQHVDLALDATMLNENDISKASVGTLHATTETVESIKPLTASLNTELESLNSTTVAITAMMPDIQATAKNVNDTSKHLNGTSADVEHAVHEYVYPGPWKRAWGYISGVGLDVGKLFIP